MIFFGVVIVNSLNIQTVSDFWNNVQQDTDNVSVLVKGYDHIDVVGYQALLLLIQNKSISITDINRNIIETMTMLGAVLPTEVALLTSANADMHKLDESELRRTIMTLNLAIAQIDLSMTEGEYSVSSLIETFNYMGGEVERIKRVVHDPEATVSDVIQVISAESDILNERFTDSIVAFQFYDKLSQRLHHVSESLSALTDIISDETSAVSTQVWDNFLKKMERYASMQEEYDLFEMIFKQGVSTEVAVQSLKERLSEKMTSAREKHKADAPDYEEDIELF